MILHKTTVKRASAINKYIYDIKSDKISFE